MQQYSHKSFGLLFKQLRLHAGISTLKELGNLLAEHGYIYEDSILSHWQAGRKVPSKRHVLLTMLKLFNGNNKLSLDIANNFLQEAGQGYLTHEEIVDLNFVTTKIPFYVPPKIPSFVARDVEIDMILETLSKKNTVYIVGQAGVGKTALTIEIGHRLEHQYPDGILWYRTDTSDLNEILNSIAKSYGEDVNNIQNIEIKASMVRSLLNTKKTLLILDNLESTSQLHILLQNSSCCDVLITTKYQDIIPPSSYSLFLQPFQIRETFLLYKKILGEGYLEKNEKFLIQINEYVGGLPLALTVLAKEISLNKNGLNYIKRQLEAEGVKLDYLTYDNKNLYKAINVSFKLLSEESKILFLSLGVFKGKDFSSAAVAYINSYPSSKTERIIQDLINRCLLERSNKNRLRVHPTTFGFIKEHHSFEKYIELALQFFISQFKKYKNKRDKIISDDFDNICYLFKDCYSKRYFSTLFEIWPYFGFFLWNKGQWILYKEFGILIYNAASLSKNSIEKMKCCIQDIGWCSYWQGNLVEAEKYTKEGRDLALKMDDKTWLSFAQQRLGKIYQSKYLYKESNDILLQSLTYFETKNLYEKMGDTLTYIGENYWMQQELKIAQVYLQKALLIVDSINDLPQKAIIYSHLAGIELLNREYEKSQYYFKESIAIADNLKRNAGGYFWNNLGLGLVNHEIGDSKKAQEFLHTARKEMVKLGMEEKIFQMSVFFIALKEEINKTEFHTLSSTVT